jgi:hypothetical protein
VLTDSTAPADNSDVNCNRPAAAQEDAAVRKDASMNDDAKATVLARTPAIDAHSPALNLGATLKPSRLLALSATIRRDRAPIGHAT